MSPKNAHGGCSCHDKSSGPDAEFKKLVTWAGLRLFIEFVVSTLKD